MSDRIALEVMGQERSMSSAEKVIMVEEERGTVCDNIKGKEKGGKAIIRPSG